MSLLRRIVNRVLRPSAVTRAQHDYVKQHPICAACGSDYSVQAHHIKPYHLFPELAADPTNFISLCEGFNECHLIIGHGGCFRFYNPDVVADAARGRFSSAETVTKAKRLPL